MTEKAETVELYLPAGWAFLFLDTLADLDEDDDDGSYEDMLEERINEGFVTNCEDPSRKGCLCYEFEDSFEAFSDWALVTLGTDVPVDMTSQGEYQNMHDASRFGVPGCIVHRFTFIPEPSA